MNGRRYNNNRNNNNRRYNNNNNNNNGNNNRRFNNSNVDDESANISPQQRRNFENKRDQYLMKAKDALSAGDKVEAENLFQHADHYFRMANLGLPPRSNRLNEQVNNHHQADNIEQNFEPKIPDYVSDASPSETQSLPAEDISSLPFLQAELPSKIIE